MAKQSIRKQAMLLTFTNTLVRALGFAMRVWFSRVLGAEIMGIMELSSSVHMLAITPATAGIPLAVSRLTAKAPPDRKEEALHAAKLLVRRISLILIPSFLLLSPLFARLLGDERTFPSLIMSAPCILILGYSAAYNGYCYGMENAWPPALSELTEQVLRFSVAFLLLKSLPNLSPAWMAAVPGFSTTVAEAVGLALVLWLLHLPRAKTPPSESTKKRLFRLTLPPTVTRLCNTALRSLNAILIPMRLRFSGLTAVEATARFGMLTGMVMPLLMLPSVFTGALAMLSTPAMAARENNLPALRSISFRLLIVSGLTGIVCTAGLYLLAPILAVKMYRLPELAPLIRYLCPTVFMLSLHQVLGGMIAGLGRQKQALYGTLFGAGITLVSSWFLTASPALRLYGAALSFMLGQACTVIWNCVVLFLRLTNKCPPAAGIENDGEIASAQV